MFMEWVERGRPKIGHLTLQGGYFDAVIAQCLEHRVDLRAEQQEIAGNGALKTQNEPRTSDVIDFGTLARHPFHNHLLTVGTSDLESRPIMNCCNVHYNP